MKQTIITCEIDQEIIIGDDIKLLLVGINRGNKVRIGVDAPRNLPVFRKELLKPAEASNHSDTEKKTE